MNLIDDSIWLSVNTKIIFDLIKKANKIISPKVQINMLLNIDFDIKKITEYKLI